MNIYHYDGTTKVYKSTTVAVSGHGVPANATTTAPPTPASGYQAVFNETNTSWSTQLIPTTPSTSPNTSTAFENMTLAQRLSYYGLGDLVTHVLGQTTLAKTSTVNAQIAAVQTTVDGLQTDVTAMGTTNAQVTANQQLIAELTEDINDEGRLKLEGTA
jgi:hypothetical protein